MTRRDLAFMVALVISVVGSALIVVKTKHENRTLVHEIEQLRAEKARLETEWAQLQLEEATLAQHARVEQIARDKLRMTAPHDTRIVRATAAATEGRGGAAQ
jgi:cell division protein FtsL